MRPPIVLLTGFGQPGDALTNLNGRLIRAGFETSITSVCQLAATAWSVRDNSCKEVFAPAGASLYALELGEFLNKEFPNQTVSLFGWSMGGMVALEFAHYFPQRLDRLVLASSSGCFVNKEEQSGDYTAGVSELLLRNMRLGLNSAKKMTLIMFYKNVFQAGVAKEDFEKVVESSMAINKEVLLHGLQYLQKTDLRQFLPTIKHAVMLFHGDQDRVIPLESSQYLVRNLPQARLSVLPGQGHAFCLEVPEVIFESLEEFFGQ